MKLQTLDMAAILNQNNPLLPMSVSNILQIGGVTILNLLLPFLTASTNIPEVIGSTLNMIVGGFGMLILFMLRNSIKYHITFSNYKQPLPVEKELADQNKADETEDK